jgi:hypothetical protein
MTFAQRRNRLTTNFSERIPVVKRCISVILFLNLKYCKITSAPFPRLMKQHQEMLPFCFGAVVKIESLKKKDCETRRKHRHSFVLSRRPTVYKRDAIFPSGWVRRSVRPYLLKANNTIAKLLDSCVVLFTQTMREALGRELLRWRGQTSLHFCAW